MPTQIHTGTEEAVRVVAKALLAGEPVAIPTETVYGLAVDARNPEACRRVFAIKGRPLIDPLIVHVALGFPFRDWVEWPPEAERILRAFWPGPITCVVNQKGGYFPPVVTAGLPSVALRCPQHPIAQSILQACQFPLAAPSANPFGSLSPTRVEHVLAHFGHRLTHVVDGGPCAIGLESTIVDLRTPGSVSILRPGAISAESVAAVIGQAVGYAERSGGEADHGPQVAPGSLSRHYAPRTPLRLLAYGESVSGLAGPKDAILRFNRPCGEIGFDSRTFWLTENGDLQEAAASLFALLHRLDGLGFDHLMAEMPPAVESGLGRALADRLRRAAQPNCGNPGV